ncbi:Signal peptidase complex subunit [Fasciolopsis buskii]|uniref:Signal peptidase complex subunit 2 n=1 Tax=Fasciolopsis buskii TaxID=27845 RepID=A0A8E0RU27_9TREM|nr:Signal peptidase complex subunit [Fasciolopsis buski]
MPKLSATDITVDKWNGSAVKNALDDAAKEILAQRFNLVENHSLFDGRLFLCTVSVLVAGFGVVWDYFYPHPQSRLVLIVCVSVYFVLSCVITCYVMFVEKNIFYTGEKADPTGLDPPDVWKLASQVNRYDPHYRLTLRITNGSSKKTKQSTMNRRFDEFFDLNGKIRSDLYNAAVTRLTSDILDKKE